MKEPEKTIFTVFWIAGVISLGFVFRYFMVVRNELIRARRAGELPDDFPTGSGRGIPTRVIFSNMLPAVEKDRRKLVVALWFFALFWLVGVISGQIAGMHR